MSTRYYSTNAQPTQLSAACTDVANTIQVTATTGLPATPYTLALDYGTAQQELVLVTNVSGTTLTVTRGFDNTTAQAHSLGAAVRHVHSAIDFRDSRTHEAANGGVHGVSGSVVGTTDAQALTNKDLTSPSNTFPASLATDAEVTTAVSNHAALTATHGATGAVVGTTNTPALTNKDLTSTTNSFPAYVAPVGAIFAFAGTGASTPAGWLVCDGSSVLRATYPALFALIGTTYGSVDGTHFTLPNLKGRVIVGVDAAQTEFDVLGETGGEKTHQLTIAEMPIHHHQQVLGGSLTNVNPTAGTGVIGTANNQNTGDTGGDAAHNNLQPYIALNYIIRAA